LTPQERIFVAKVRDLRRRTNNDWLQAQEDPSYELFMAAPLLRELLMGDPQAQIHLVNRDRRLKIRFDVRRAADYDELFDDPDVTFYAIARGLYPGDGSPGSPVEKSLTLDQFLAERIVVMPGRAVLSVRDVIDYVANAAGAVHFGDRTRDNRAVVEAVAAFMEFGYGNLVLETMIAIAKVTADALEPLVDRINSDAGTD
jgi:hypothetical protein